jgi:hypothetical protein
LAARVFRENNEKMLLLLKEMLPAIAGDISCDCPSMLEEATISPIEIVEHF